MNFDFSDDQKQLKDEARRFLDKESPVSRVRAVLDAEETDFDADLWRKIAEQGWLGATIPEAYGGLGLGHLELCCLAEELGRSLAPVPFLSTVYLFTEALLIAGTEDQKQRYLPKVAGGECISSFATAERPGPVTAKSIAATVEGDSLTGAKLPVVDGGIADVAIVLALDGKKPSLFLVDLDQPGVTRQRLTTMDGSRNAARLDFSGAKAEPLGAPGAGIDLMHQVFDRAAVPIAFEQVGGADRALEMAKDYALARFAFSRPIASYQAIKHKLADVFVKNTIARSNAYYGAWALASGSSELPLAAAASRVAACDAYWFAAKENIHVHGGMGFTWEFDCHLHYRRSIQLSLVVGAARAWKLKLVSQLQSRHLARQAA